MASALFLHLKINIPYKSAGYKTWSGVTHC